MQNEILCCFDCFKNIEVRKNNITMKTTFNVNNIGTIYINEHVIKREQYTLNVLEQMELIKILKILFNSADGEYIITIPLNYNLTNEQKKCLACIGCNIKYTLPTKYTYYDYNSLQLNTGKKYCFVCNDKIKKTEIEKKFSNSIEINKKDNSMMFTGESILNISKYIDRDCNIGVTNKAEIIILSKPVSIGIVKYKENFVLSDILKVISELYFVCGKYLDHIYELNGVWIEKIIQHENKVYVCLR
jgi:hypothetical protein